MQIEPALIEPGYAKRWLADAKGLILRGPFVFAPLFVCLTFLLQLPGIGYLMWPLGAVTCAMLIEYVRMLDEYEVTFARWLAASIQGIKSGAGVLKKQGPLYAIAIALGLLMLNGLLALGAAATDPSNPSTVAVFDIENLAHWAIHPGSPLLSTSLTIWLGTHFFGFTPSFHALLPALKGRFDVQGRLAAQLCIKATAKNPGPSLHLLSVDSVTLILALILPLAAPVLFCLLPALSYVACRELYGEGPGNKVQKAKQSAMIGETTSSPVLT